MNRTEEYRDLKIEEALREEIEAARPDMLDQLMKECGFPEAGSAEIEKTEIEMTEGEMAGSEKAGNSSPRFSRARIYTFLTRAAAAVLCLVIAAGSYGLGMRRGATGAARAEDPADSAVLPAEPAETAAVVSIDINPSVELTVDASERVIACRGVNEDGVDILHGLDLTGTDLHVAAYAIVGAIVTEGYLTDDTNSLLVSVIARDDAAGRALEEKLSGELHTFLRKAPVQAAVFGQHAADDEEVERFARDNGISYGRAFLIRTLLARSPRMTEASLLALSTQELLVLWEKGGRTDSAPDALTGEDPADGMDKVFGTVSTSGLIPEEEALAAALAAAGVEAAAAENVRVEFDCEDGVLVYEVEFSAADIAYEIDVNARTGEIVRREQENRADEEADDRDDDIDDDDQDNDIDDDDDDRDDDHDDDDDRDDD